ncbi:P-loop containing nucleoside triphosphate hydrolase [Phytophthora cactorum]|nr:P-loop containing nucleoside triphosphate hydrolase [Phytophthora cactorum]
MTKISKNVHRAAADSSHGRHFQWEIVPAVGTLGCVVPSNDQLTTRCPTQLILARADTFRGTVRHVRFQSNGENDEGEEKQDLNRLEDVPDAITKLTQKLVDEGQHISDDQIVIECVGRNCPTSH